MDSEEIPKGKLFATVSCTLKDDCHHTVACALDLRFCHSFLTS